jgi:hypothetical protein
MGDERKLDDLYWRVLGLERKQAELEREVAALRRLFAADGSQVPPDASGADSTSGDWELIPWPGGQILLPPGVSPEAARAAFNQALADQEPDPPATG